VQYKVLCLNSDLFTVCILAIPVLAVLLDLKVCEFGIHANVIDCFIMQNYKLPEIIPKWERVKWNIDSDSEESDLVFVRSLSTLSVTVVPTCILVIVASIAIPRIGILWRAGAASLFCLIYLACTRWTWNRMYRQTKALKA
jgi:hypothetical protein